MRFLKFLFLLFAMLIIFFLSSGWLMPESTYTTTQRVNLPTTIVFDLYTDASNLEKWYLGLQSVSPMEQKVDKIGQKIKMRVNLQGETVELSRTITQYQKPQLISYHFESFEMIKKEVVTFKNIDGQTLITNQVSTTGKSYFLKCMYATFSRFMKADDQAILDSFKRYIEKNKK